MLLSVGIVEGDCVRCRYHGWQYDQSGQCVDQPAEPKSFAAKVQIASYPVEEYFGFIWVYLGESPVPELPRWPELEQYGRFHVVELRKWNYFHDLENTVDDVHQFWVHATGVYQDDGKAGEIPEITAEPTDFGLTQSSLFTNGFVRRLALIMPNTLYFNAGAGVLRGFKSFLWNVPVDDENHMMFFLFIAAHLPPDVGAMVAQGVRDGREVSLPAEARRRGRPRGAQWPRAVGGHRRPTGPGADRGRHRPARPGRTARSVAEPARQLGRGDHPAAQALCARTRGDRGGSSAHQIPDTRCGCARAARRLTTPTERHDSHDDRPRSDGSSIRDDREDPDQARKFGGVCKFALSGEGGRTFIIDLTDDPRVIDGDGDAQCTISMALPDFIDLIEGRTRSTRDCSSREGCSINGDWRLAMKFKKLSEIMGGRT